MTNPVIEIVVVGNEILSGRTRDRNAPYMIAALAGAGYGVAFVSVVGDELESEAATLSHAAGRADLVLVTGGLGPTSDDITFEAAARAFGRELVLNEVVLRRIGELFRKRKRFMSDSNRRQAMLPDGSEPLDNPLGTAPALRISVDGGGGTGRGSTVYFMPGVPNEMQAIFDNVIMPRIGKAFEPLPIETATVTVAGISESELYDIVRGLPGAAEALAFYPQYSGIEIRIRTGVDAPVSASGLRESIVGLLGEKVFSTSGESLEAALGRMLIDSGLTVAVAESCTGGLVSHLLTNLPGSSAYMLLGVVAYSNGAKRDVLGVKERIIASHGAVSKETAAAMAEGVRELAGSDIGVSTTGIAGPGGGSPSKPVGLMYTGLSTRCGTVTKKLQFTEDRLINKNRMTQSVLDEVRRYIVNNEIRTTGKNIE
ncbi:MAG: CinA family nicotinamide mononucleotide deamidase-related protein [Candidatus Latescibacteria bacterium]|nr:CinA family nicotinamide mononucleotide deamidase-related protein [Candidatus Latescibacterota bacterium]